MNAYTTVTARRQRTRGVVHLDEDPRHFRFSAKSGMETVFAGSVREKNRRGVRYYFDAVGSIEQAYERRQSLFKRALEAAAPDAAKLTTVAAASCFDRALANAEDVADLLEAEGAPLTFPEVCRLAIKAFRAEVEFAVLVAELRPQRFGHQLTERRGR